MTQLIARPTRVPALLVALHGLAWTAAFAAAQLFARLSADLRLEQCLLRYQWRKGSLTGSICEDFLIPGPLSLVVWPALVATLAVAVLHVAGRMVREGARAARWEPGRDATPADASPTAGVHPAG